MSLYHLNVFFHLLAAVFWLGGTFFLGAVGAPVLRRIEPPDVRARLFNRLGRAFRNAGWLAIGVLLVTGVLNLWFRGLLRWSVLGSAEFWASRYGTALAWKLGLVAIMIVNSAVHDFLLGPMAYRERGTGRARALRRWSAWSARLNAIFGVALVYVAVRLARGG